MRKSTLERAKEAEALIELATQNPWQTFSFSEIADICGWGKNIPSALASIGAPVTGKRMRPASLWAWIDQNREAVNKIRGD